MKIQGLTLELAVALIDYREKSAQRFAAEQEAERVNKLRDASPNPYDNRTKAARAVKVADEAEMRARRVYQIAFNEVARLVINQYRFYTDEQLIEGCN